ncbi:E3 ubiquitin-protein ligase TRIM39-like [Corythoichthys intestinalis]|uniref:E3 ubiquitin-protein ligase TRIM39-like n=1 Tax=Corythoichthys intestinalis TaxID=161448 RepID=UPI0025A5C1F1|nr:E3 ubiquitin-protein ligase TRIM39-like [Corythoichthys intestinalis]XP_061807826.1 E3 ubiquitin-protein ligase TRIM39-like [Nerophis lumbriciformis]
MAGRLEEDLRCPTCLDIFKDPVMLPCGHNYCRACLQKWKDVGQRSCPLCRTAFRSMDTPPNLALRNMCENFLRATIESKDICSLHKEELKLFCLDHQELVCLICRDAKIHGGHKMQPVEEVAKDHKDKLQDGLQNVRMRLNDYKTRSDNCHRQLAHIKAQGEKVQRKIKKDFEELRHFLDVEEKARLSAVREEEQKKSQTMREKIAALGKDMVTLSNTIRNTEDLLSSGDMSVLKNFKTTMRKIRELPDEPDLPGGALLDEAKHVDELKFNVWQKMKTVSNRPNRNTPDPGPTNLTLEEAQRCPESVKWNIVLGSALDSGRHEWDVEVLDHKDWLVGILWGEPYFPGEMTGWLIGFKDGKYTKPGGAFGAWHPPVELRRIRVMVDFNRRSVSFSEPLTKTQLWSINNCSDWPDLSGYIKMYPSIYTRSITPLTIIPVPTRAMSLMSSF